MGIWVDTDMGTDDIFAILLVAQGREIDGMSLCFGNVQLDRVARNAAGAVQAFDWQIPLYRGAEMAILGGVETAERILGPTGIPSRGRGLPEVTPAFSAALPALSGWLEQISGAEILALGPLTNLATLALARPDLLHRVGRVIWMGGARGRGNHSASAEFNALADPEALAILLAREVPLTMVDLDACRQVEITEADVVNLVASDLLRDLLGGYLDIALNRGRAAMALYDPVAAALLLQPNLFTLAPAEISVELSGLHSRGRTIVDQRSPHRANGRIIADLKAEAIRSLCLSALEAAG